MAELTKEWLLKTITELEEERDAVPGAVNEDAANALAAMKLSLASLEAEAVAYMIGGHYLMHAQDPKVDNYTSAVPLYTAPPAPVSVPDGYRLQPISEYDAMCAAMLQGADGKPELTVWYGAMPETNGKTNWTAILHRKGEGRCMNGFTIDRSEYPGRVLYAADRVRYLIGEKSERPSILDYDADAHSGYMKTGNSPVIPDGWVACSERMPEVGVKVLCFPVNDEPIHATYNGQVWLQDISWSVSDEPIDNVISCSVFHWMPLPAAPQQEAL
ncbi:DUF551 domain-containing protein [Enterobacter hormaechei]|uniref:DUF551 domain-containing protein n=1 Tax=Enterobacter hormaechei TaxID=158836 RepID=UPI003F543561